MEAYGPRLLHAQAQQMYMEHSNGVQNVYNNATGKADGRPLTIQCSSPITITCCFPLLSWHTRFETLSHPGKTGQQRGHTAPYKGKKQAKHQNIQTSYIHRDVKVVTKNKSLPTRG